MKEIFSKVLKQDAIRTDSESLSVYAQDWLRLGKPNATCILFPSSTEEVAQVVKLAGENKISLVPSGGRTGLSGGACAYGGEVVISLEKMNKLLEISATGLYAKAQAGVITQKLQQEVAKHNLFFPVDFASKGSSQLGGNAATNAGGIRVIRYGLFRDWVIGLTAVDGQGNILKLNNTLIKNQTGYDLRHLLIGSEGTLAIITELTLRLTQPPQKLTRLLLALDSLDNIIPILTKIRQTNLQLSAFEFFQQNALNKVVEAHKISPPFSENYNSYLVIEFEEITDIENIILENLCLELSEETLITDAIIGQNTKQTEQIMLYRELISETLSSITYVHKNDISVPIENIPSFCHSLQSLIADNYTDYEVVLFGHIGDGNIHVNILKPSSLPLEVFQEHCHNIDQITFRLVSEFQGSISAEHGVGLLKRDFLSCSRSPVEIQIMRDIKRSFDPLGILNPGKLLRE